MGDNAASDASAKARRVASYVRAHRHAEGDALDARMRPSTALAQLVIELLEKRSGVRHELCLLLDWHVRASQTQAIPALIEDSDSRAWPCQLLMHIIAMPRRCAHRVLMTIGGVPPSLLSDAQHAEAKQGFTDESNFLLLRVRELFEVPHLHEFAKPLTWRTREKKLGRRQASW